MGGIWPQLLLLAVLIVVNGILAGSEMAFVSLREGQLQRLEALGGKAALAARLARSPNRFLSAVQIGITLAGFLASAEAAVSLAKPLQPHMGWLGDGAEAVSVVTVTVILSFLTLVFGELAPKRVAMQRAERWAVAVARPLSLFVGLARPAVWLLSRSTDAAVRLGGGDPSRVREDVSEEEIRDMLSAQPSVSDLQQTIITGAFEIADRRLRQVMRPRQQVVTIDPDASCESAVTVLATAGHSRAPVAPRGELDQVAGVVHVRDLVFGAGTVAGHTRPVPSFPESLRVLVALRELQRAHEHMAVVIDDFGGVEGIVTIEDLLEEIVGEIYDETDRDIEAVVRRPDGALILPGSFPVHDLPDIGMDNVSGPSTTVAGLLLERLGHIPSAGEAAEVSGRRITVLEVEGRTIARVRVEAPPRPRKRRPGVR